MVKEPPANAGDRGSVPDLRSSHAQPLSLCTTTVEPVRSRAQEPQLLSRHAATAEARTP